MTEISTTFEFVWPVGQTCPHFQLPYMKKKRRKKTEDRRMKKQKEREKGTHRYPLDSPANIF
jgi:hypothetical protein